MMMSPSSNASASASITASVGAPACTITSARRGERSAAANSAIVSVRTKSPSSPCSESRASVFPAERLWTATVYPCRAKLRAMFEPITARPVTPMSAVPTVPAAGCASSRSVLMGLSVVDAREASGPASMRAIGRAGGGVAAAKWLIGQTCTECKDSSIGRKTLGNNRRCVVTLMVGPDDLDHNDSGDGSPWSGRLRGGAPDPVRGLYEGKDQT